MERREVLRRTIAGGMTVVITHLLADTPVEAAKKKPKVQFHEGTINGEGVEGWKALIAVNGGTVRGTCWGPNSVNNGHYNGWRVRGRKRNDTFQMDFFALSDSSFSKPIGKCGGKARGKKFRAGFTLFDAPVVQGGKSEGQMEISEVPLSPATQRENSGVYDVEFFDNTEGVEGEPAGSFRATVDANGKFRISDGTSNSPKLQGKLPKDTVGRWGMTSEGAIYTATQADELVIAEAPVDYSEVNKGGLAKDEQGVQADDLNCFFIFCAQYVCTGINLHLIPEP